MNVVIVLAIGYFLGSVSTAWLVARFKGVDILQMGSGNAGFTNVWRSLGIKMAVIVLVGDIGKGVLAAWFGNILAGTSGMILAVVTAILGHTYSVFLGFKGGKGVAVGAGLLLYISPPTFFLCLITLSSLAYFTGYMSVGSITAAFLCPIFLLLFKAPPLIVLTFTISAAYVIWMHRKNIQRLRRGTENKLNFKGMG